MPPTDTVTESAPATRHLSTAEANVVRPAAATTVDREAVATATTAAALGLDTDRPVYVPSWTPHDGQLAVLLAEYRYRVVVCGRRWGKSEMCAYLVTQYALTHPGAHVWWVAPTYTAAHDYGWDTVKAMLPADAIEKRYLTEPRKFILVNGAVISFRSADNEDSLRGPGLDLLVIDEAGSVPERAWTEELRPTLMDTEGRMVAIGTPRGRDWFYEWYLRGQSSDYPAVGSWQAPSYMNPYVANAEIDAAADEMPAHKFRQEILAEFLSDYGGVFPGVEARNVEAYDWRATDGSGPYRHGWDFGRQQNWTVGITLDATGTLVNFERVQQTAWSAIQARIEAVNARYPGTHRVDATRDNKIVADLEEAGVRVDPVTFTARTKRGLIEDLAASLETHEVTLPPIDVLLTELQAFEFSLTPSGNLRYHAPEGMHDDCVDALALAAKRREHTAADHVGTWGVTRPGAWSHTGIGSSSSAGSGSGSGFGSPGTPGVWSG